MALRAAQGSRGITARQPSAAPRTMRLFHCDGRRFCQANTKRNAASKSGDSGRIRVARPARIAPRKSVFQWGPPSRSALEESTQTDFAKHNRAAVVKNVAKTSVRGTPQ